MDKRKLAGVQQATDSRNPADGRNPAAEKGAVPPQARRVVLQRSTAETDIALTLQIDATETPNGHTGAGGGAGTGTIDSNASGTIDSGVPFFDHLLHAMALHGRMRLQLRARGDLQVDAHHTIEDVGLVLGTAVAQIQALDRSLERFGHAVLPMDDALVSATLDLCNRPFLVYRAHYPQEYVGGFHIVLLREFFQALVGQARCNLHLHALYGNNSHHISEALFKALGRALHDAFRRHDRAQPLSTKGMV